MEGITAKGKPLKDHLDIRGHNEAINFLLSIVKDTRPISEADIRNLHQMILVEPYNIKAQTSDGLPTTKRITLGEYKTMPNHVKTATGEMHYYAAPEETPAKMQDLMEWYSETSNNKDIHPVVVAALFHHKFVSIHPFDDGNGRLSRILMNLILMQKGFPPVIVKMDDRQNYYSLLSRADNGDGGPFIEYIAEGLFSSLQLYLKAAMGSDIDEDEDIDKEIALFKTELLSSTDVKEQRSNDVIENILESQIQPLMKKLDAKALKFGDLFFEYESSIGLNIGSPNLESLESLNQFFEQERIYKNGRLKNLKSIVLAFVFRKFKNSENDFNTGALINVIFEDYHYRFSNIDNDTFLSKLYHEKLTKNEEQQIIRVFVEDLKKLISSESKRRDA
ncbi:MAG TPA: Fic family protein [Mucilaginibacter sp.]